MQSAQPGDVLVVDNAGRRNEGWERERRQAAEIKGRRSLREQLDFARYLEKRVVDPSYTFRKHLRKLSGASDE